ncbi:MAG: hypothetical protein AB7P14_03380 [Blastocatellales bacterium]
MKITAKNVYDQIVFNNAIVRFTAETIIELNQATKPTYTDNCYPKPIRHLWGLLPD